MTDRRLPLPGVTLCAATSVAVGPTLRALRRSLDQVAPERTLLLCDVRPDPLDAGIGHVAIEPMRSRRDYSRFMLHRLADHVATDHVLVSQWDGYVVNAGAWSDEFRAYDYIGAPWPQFPDGRNVGNGGFSLRSRRLLEATRRLAPADVELEDVAIGRELRPALEAEGLRFAPPELAERFSVERLPARLPAFGFHGVFNLPRYLDDDSVLALIDEVGAEQVGIAAYRTLFATALAEGRHAMLWRLVGHVGRSSMGWRDRARLARYTLRDLVAGEAAMTTPVGARGA